MAIKFNSIDEYLESLTEDKKMVLNQLRKIIKKHLSKGFEEVFGYGMIGYVVPHKLYPAGYHCNPKLPLPFMNIAAQKNFISLHHLGIYADTKLSEWVIAEYKKAVGKEPDMGKGCIRFKNPDEIPFEVIGKLAAKISVKDYVAIYERSFKKK